VRAVKKVTVPLIAALCSALLVAGMAVAGDDDRERRDHRVGSFAVGLWGDLPYTPQQRAQGVPNLIEDMNASKLAFSIFDGDVKNGRTVCRDSEYTDARRRFDSLRAPSIYVPGDNEWTDCHRKSNNDSPPRADLKQPYDSLERLAFLRRTLASSPRSFGKRTIRLRRQSAAYPENVRWERGGVVFAGLHVVGSDNNSVPDPDIDESATSYRTRQQRVADQQEFVRRQAATNRWVEQAFARARRTGAPGVMLVMQANPIFDSPDTADVDERAQAGDDGFKALIDVLRRETIAYGREVVLVHGDSHYFRVDKPLKDGQGRQLENFTRVETFGEADPHWVRATVRPRARRVFRFDQRIVPANVVPR